MEVNILLCDIMISITKFAMAVMLIAGFQQASADVCKLKVKGDILRVFEENPDRCEVWVDVRDGRIDNLKFDGSVHIVKSSVAAFKDNGELKDEYKDAIFCNDKGEVVIIADHASIEKAKANLDLHRYDFSDYNTNAAQRKIKKQIIKLKVKIKQEAKQQFENIIKSGLVITKNHFNDNIFFDSFVGDKWQMPGISAFVKNGKNIANVYCAMKTARNNNCTFWELGDYYTTNANKKFYNHEHTERQLIVNHMSNNNISVDLGMENHKITFNSGKELLSKNTEKNDLKSGSLFIWTKGNPCTVASSDNGNICCTSWYAKLKDYFEQQQVVVNVYFSEVSGNNLDSSGGKNCSDLVKVFDKLYIKTKDKKDNIMMLYECFLSCLDKRNGVTFVELLNMFKYYDANNGIKAGNNLNWIIDSLYPPQNKLIELLGADIVWKAFQECHPETNGRIIYNVLDHNQ